MSATYVVDLFAAVVAGPSIITDPILSGVGPNACSGAIIGAPVDLLAANSLTNLAVFTSLTTSGQLRVRVQTSPDTTSGNFTDPTSGLDRMPTRFQSGGLFWVNSGSTNLLSGQWTGVGFQRPDSHRYARATVLSGDFFAGQMQVGFIAQRRFTTSGPGYSLAPGSGVVNV